MIAVKSGIGWWLVCACGVMNTVLPVRAEVSIPAIFGDNMVLQQQTPLPVWGRASPEETVTVRFAGQIKTTTADAAGNWRVNLDPLRASPAQEGQDFTVVGTNTITFRNVLIGEVWLGGGQSNMCIPVSQSEHDRTYPLDVDRPLIRYTPTPSDRQLHRMAGRPGTEDASCLLGWQDVVGGKRATTREK
jgi:sialate O-acetylesterase